MGATFPAEDALVIDLAAPFGWSGSPAFYGAFGGAITWLVGTNSPATVSDSDDSEPFFGYEWVDDHILTELQALGLVWNTVDRTVSMPFDKVQNCRDRVEALLSAEKTTKQQLQKLLGSLRHLTTCLRSAKPFFQQLQTVCTRLQSFQSIRLNDSSRRDLQWFHHILSDGHLDNLPLRFYGTLPVPTINLYMDASDAGLVVLHPSRNEFIQLRFDDEEIRLIKSSESPRFTINVREHFCMALAAWSWGAGWKEDFNFPHIVCWSDNISAVSWINQLHSKNFFGQEINRAIGLAEAVFRIRLSARHLPGSTNRMADAGSRAWTTPYSRLWSELSCSWHQVQVPEHWRRIYKEFSATCSPTHWPRRHANDTGRHGSNGGDGAQIWSTAPGYRTTNPSRLANSCSSRCIATDTAVDPRRPEEIRYRPSSPRSALSRGIIVGNSATASAFSPTTPWQSKASSDSSLPLDPNNQSHYQLFGSSTRVSTSTQPTTVSYGATVMGFFFLLRCSEYLSKGSQQYQFAIRRSDISFFDQDGHARIAFIECKSNFAEGKTTKLVSACLDR